MSQGLVRKLTTARQALREGGVSAFASLFGKNLRYLAASATGVEIDGCRFKSQTFPQEVWPALVSGEYESSERQMIKQYLDPESPIIELGGGLGVITCVANSLLKRPRKHIVVEASSDSVLTIKANVARNNCEIEIVNAAIAYGSTSVTFWVNSNLPYSNSLAQLHNSSKQITVPAITLETLFKQHPLTGCTLLCDIEGGEYEMVKNELSLISEHVSCIIIETHPRLKGQAQTEDMLAALVSGGFQIRDTANDVYVLTRS